MPITWRNWHETVAARVDRYENLRNGDDSRSTLGGYNATTAKCLEHIATAVANDSSLRAAGAAWSFTPIAVAEGTVLGTQRLNYRFNLQPSFLQRDYGEGHSPVLLQGGISIADVNTYLARRGQALKTSGASNGQTIAGALATGTHGAAIDIGSVPDYVVGIHIAVGGGRSVWLERQSYPVLKDHVIEWFGAHIERDDKLFNAALVSFGSFGIVLGVVVEPEPLYYLHSFRDKRVLSDELWDAVETMNFEGVDLPGGKGRPRHLELALNPYGDDPAEIITTAMYHAESRPPGSKPKPASGFGKSDDTLGAIGFISDRFSGVTEWAAKLFDLAYKPHKNIAGPPGEIFSDTTTRGRSASSGVGVPVSRAREAFELSANIVRAEKAPAIIALRFVKATEATLGFTMHKPVTCILDIDGANSNRTRSAHRLIWQELRTQGIPHTFHWGKLNDLSGPHLRTCYGNARVDDWKDQRRRIFDQDDDLKRVFANQFTDQLEISD